MYKPGAHIGCIEVDPNILQASLIYLFRFQNPDLSRDTYDNGLDKKFNFQP